jgi:hypothetical protein
MVKTKIEPSKISGTGLFADQFIPKGAIVWKFNKDFDLLLSRDETKTLSKPAKEQFYNYAYFDKKYHKYLLCFDDARFFNHSENFNCDESASDITTALRDINVGEEMTVNYRDFYGDIKDHPEAEKLHIFYGR